jgi:S1-C subfamily serine protease
VASYLEKQTVALVSPRIPLPFLFGDEDESNVRVYCSGVWVGQTTILTAEHCVHKKAVGDAVLYVVHSDVFDGAKERNTIAAREAKLLKKDETHDLALLQVVLAYPSHAIAEMTADDVKPGDTALAMGHSLGLWYSFSKGDVAAIREDRLPTSFEDPIGSIFWIQATTPTSPGNSGGGLFDATGHLIGIVSRSYTSGENLNFFVHKKHVALFLNSAGISVPLGS